MSKKSSPEQSKKKSANAAGGRRPYNDPIPPISKEVLRNSIEGYMFSAAGGPSHRILGVVDDPRVVENPIGNYQYPAAAGGPHSRDFVVSEGYAPHHDKFGYGRPLSMLSATAAKKASRSSPPPEGTECTLCFETFDDGAEAIKCWQCNAWFHLNAHNEGECRGVLNEYCGKQCPTCSATWSVGCVDERERIFKRYRKQNGGKKTKRGKGKRRKGKKSCKIRSYTY